MELREFMYVCACVRVYAFVCVYYGRVYAHVCEFMDVCKCVYLPFCQCVFNFVRLCTHVYAYIYACL